MITESEIEDLCVAPLKPNTKTYKLAKPLLVQLGVLETALSSSLALLQTITKPFP